MIMALDESTPVGQLASIADYTAYLLSKQTSTLFSVQGVDYDTLIEIIKGQQKLESCMDKMAEDVAHLSMRKRQNCRIAVLIITLRNRNISSSEKK